MPLIHILSDSIANQIAAGEVIERPANVVKELLENALDARATHISIQFTSGGIGAIKISDNGIGMDEADAQQCFCLHATSKLNTFDDLQQLQSFGFRGEALPSIASVAKVTLLTRSEGQEWGTRIDIDGDLEPKYSPCSCNVGTILTVKQLFYNLPVRRTFLKSETTENAHIVDCVRSYALAYPHIHLSLKQDSLGVFDSSSCATLEQRISEIWPKRPPRHWIPISKESELGTLLGVMSLPGKGEPNAQSIRLFLNRRPISHPAFIKAISEAYEGFIPPQSYPAVFLFLTLPSSTFDINVHPMKKEVRFKQEAPVCAFIIESIRQILTNCQSKTIQVVCDPIEPLLAASYTPPKPFVKIENSAVWVASSQRDSPSLDRSIDPIPPEPSPQGPIGFPLKLLALWQNRYALFDESPILVVLDCKGAQMRIWYEHIFQLFKKEQVGPLQTLLYPYNFTLEGTQAIAFLEAIDWLNLKKVCIARALTTEQFEISAVPQWLPLDQIALFVDQAIHALIERGQMQSIEHQLNPLLLKLVLQQKFPEVSTPEQVKQLCDELKTCSNYVTTPGGSPLWNRLSPQELLKS